MGHTLPRYSSHVLYIIGEILKGEAWTTGEKVPKQRSKWKMKMGQILPQVRRYLYSNKKLSGGDY